ncbi:MAG: putative benzoate transporter protein [Frankiales bacterium]|nr:putative benzoate transporter protein [Frankiales bacterium]
MSAAIVGYASSVAVVVSGLQAVGASPRQVGSGLVALGVVMAVASVALSLPGRVPVAVVWSTPGLALLATSGPLDGGFRVAVAGFALCGLLVAVTGLLPPLSRLLGRLPPALTSAVLAGVLLPFCLAPAQAVPELPLRAGVVVLVWLAAVRLRPGLAAPAALLAVVAVVLVDGSLDLPSLPLPRVVLVTPSFTLAAVTQVALPVYLVTMAGQNLVGLAVLQANGFTPSVRRLLVGTGLASAVGAPLASPTVNLAAITGALTAGPAAHPQPARRWVAAVAGAATYLVLALVAPLTTALVTQTDPRLVRTAAGLALLGSFAGAAATALREEATRLPAAVTLLVAASGATAGGLGSAPLGLAAGLALLAVLRVRREA